MTKDNRECVVLPKRGLMMRRGTDRCVNDYRRLSIINKVLWCINPDRLSIEIRHSLKALALAKLHEVPLYSHVAVCSVFPFLFILNARR